MPLPGDITFPGTVPSAVSPWSLPRPFTMLLAERQEASQLPPGHSAPVRGRKNSWSCGKACLASKKKEKSQKV